MWLQCNNNNNNHHHLNECLWFYLYFSWSNESSSNDVVLTSWPFFEAQHRSSAHSQASNREGTRAWLQSCRPPFDKTVAFGRYVAPSIGRDMTHSVNVTRVSQQTVDKKTAYLPNLESACMHEDRLLVVLSFRSVKRQVKCLPIDAWLARNEEGSVEFHLKTFGFVSEMENTEGGEERGVSTISNELCDRGGGLNVRQGEGESWCTITIPLTSDRNKVRSKAVVTVLFHVDIVVVTFVELSDGRNEGRSIDRHHGPHHWRRLPRE